MRKTLKMGSFLTKRIFRSTPYRVLTAHTEWLPGVRLSQYHLCSKYRGIVRDGGCPAVVAQWQSTGGSSQKCPGFDSILVTAGFFHFPLFSPHNIQIHLRVDM